MLPHRFQLLAYILVFDGLKILASTTIIFLHLFENYLPNSSVIYSISCFDFSQWMFERHVVIGNYEYDMKSLNNTILNYGMTTKSNRQIFSVHYI